MEKVLFNQIDDVFIEKVARRTAEIILKNNTETEVLSNPNRKLTIPQLIEYLPEHPARQTVYGWISNRKIPFQKHGSRVLFVQREIDEWIENGRVISHVKSMEG